MTASPSDPNARVTVNGGDPATPVALSVGANVITIVVTAEDARYQRTYTVTVTRESAPQTQTQTVAALTATFERVPAGHDGTERFGFDVRFSEALGEARRGAHGGVVRGQGRRGEAGAAGGGGPVAGARGAVVVARRAGDACGRTGLHGEGRGVRGGRPDAVERHERDGGRPGAHRAEGRQGARGP